MSSQRPAALAGLALALIAALAALSFAQPAAGRGEPLLKEGERAQPAAGQAGAAAQPAEKRPDLMGRVVASTEDGRTLTLAMPPRQTDDGRPPAADVRPEEIKVTLTERTQVRFFGVSDGEAKIAPGMMAQVWLEEGSKDTAARVRFMKREGEQRPDVQGRVAAVAPDGKSITVELRERDPQTGQEKSAGKTELRLAPHTQVLYYGVDAGGAKPTADYLVIAWLDKGSKDTAARVRFMRNEPAK